MSNEYKRCGRLSRRDRLSKALNHQVSDIVPYNIELTSQLLIKVADHLGIKPENFFDYSGNHIEKISYNYFRDVGNGCVKDEFGIIWNRSEGGMDIGMVCDSPVKDNDLKGIVFASPDIDRVREVTKKALANGKDTFKFGKIGTTYFERAWSFRGFETFLGDLVLAPKFVEELFEKILEYNMAVIDTALEYDIDGFYFGDDYGQQGGLIISPDMWRKFIKPGMAAMFARVRRAGKKVALHSCGNISAVLSDLIEIGLDVYQTVQPEIYDLNFLKKEYGRELSFWGAISTQKTLPFVSVAELKNIVKQTIEILGENGGYIAGLTHQVTNDVPAENIAALIKVLKA
jgi:uroporphyrinogen decarboxylase